MACIMVGENTMVCGIYRTSIPFWPYVFLDDFDSMLQRSKNARVLSMIITGGSLKESKHALDEAKQHSQYFQKKFQLWWGTKKKLPHRPVRDCWLSPNTISWIW